MNKNAQGWLIISYTVPAKPVNNRIKLWRRLAQAGAVPLKGAVYILPYSEEHQEFFQWLITEVQSLGGGGFFARVARIENMSDEEIIALFNGHLEKEYHALEKALGHVETRLAAVKKGGKKQETSSIVDQLRRHEREYDLIRKRDFFRGETAKRVEEKIKILAADAEKLSGNNKGMASPALQVAQRKTEDYRGKTWVTRRKPFVDRMASAWLIRKFIDDQAVFDFADNAHSVTTGGVSFDMQDADFTHVGDLCTLEVLVRSFGIKDRAVTRIAAIVHELDIRDAKYSTPEAKGLEEILSGIRKTAVTDQEALEKGMVVFDMLYASLR